MRQGKPVHITALEWLRCSLTVPLSCFSKVSTNPMSEAQSKPQIGATLNL